MFDVIYDTSLIPWLYTIQEFYKVSITTHFNSAEDTFLVYGPQLLALVLQFTVQPHLNPPGSPQQPGRAVQNQDQNQNSSVRSVTGPIERSLLQ